MRFMIIVKATKRFSNPIGEGQSAETEVRQLFELEDFQPSAAVERFRDIETVIKQ